MNPLVKAMNQTAITTNGDVTNHSTLNAVLDFFYICGSSRGMDISNSFRLAIAEDHDLTIRIMLWLRDVRGGAGERQQYRNLLKIYLNEFATNDKALGLIKATSEVGRWDDLETFVGTPTETSAMAYWVGAIHAGNGLAAKWAPRKDKKGAKPLRKITGMTEQEWRKLVVSKADTVEQQMCAKEWDSINFSHVPSQAMSKYMTAFHRNAETTFLAWKKKLTTGEAKVNAAAIFPYQIVKANGVDATVAEAQWKALPDYLGDSEERMLPIIDVSGSMLSGRASASPMDIAISLGIYISERNESTYKNVCMSFSDVPRMYQLSGNLGNKVNQIRARENVGYGTNLDKMFETLLRVSVENNVPAEDMPTKLFIVSDMQFNQGFRITHRTPTTAFQRATELYAQAGYTRPDIIFWNVNASMGNCPITVTDEGTALVSGFSPAIMKSLLANNLTPLSVMMDAISDERYDI